MEVSGDSFDLLFFMILLSRPISTLFYKYFLCFVYNKSEWE